MSITTEATPTLGSAPGVELARSEDLESAVTTEETVYTSAIPEGLDENLIQVNVSVSQTSGSAITNPSGISTVTVMYRQGYVKRGGKRACNSPWDSINIEIDFKKPATIFLLSHAGSNLFLATFNGLSFLYLAQ